MTKQKVITFFVVAAITLIILFTYTSAVVAQTMVTGPTMNRLDTKSIFGNPALTSFASSGLSMGIRGYQLGFLDNNYRLNDQYISLHSRNLFVTDLAGGFHIVQRQTPLLDETALGGSLAYRLSPKLAAGIQFSVLHYGYNEDDFDLVDPNDPVFSSGTSKTTWNTTLGVLYKPVHNISLSAGLRNLNHPVLSPSGDQYRLPREAFAGGSYSIGAFRGMLDLRLNEFGLKSYLFAELFSIRGDYLRVGTDDAFELMEIDAQLNTGRGLNVNYQLQYPLNDVGSLGRGTHLIGVSFPFNRSRAIPKQRDLPQSDLAYAWPVAEPEPALQLVVKADNEHVYMKEVEIRYVVDERITDERLSRLSLGDLPNTDAVSGNVTLPFRDREQVPSAPTSIEMSRSYSNKYNQFLDQITGWAKEEQERLLTIVAANGNPLRATGIRNRITGSSSDPVRVSIQNAEMDSLQQTISDIPLTRAMLEDQQTLIVEPDEVLIKVLLSSSPRVAEWRLTVENDQGEIVKTITGNGTLPPIISWNWQNNDRRYVDPGVYSYYLEATNTQGRTVRSNKRLIYVQKVVRKITVRISEIPENLDELIDSYDEIDLILKND